MTESKDTSQAAAAPQADAPRKPLTPEAQRALAEAEARRAAAREAEAKDAPAEINGRGGLDPVRYGDWEIKGLTSDF